MRGTASRCVAPLALLALLAACWRPLPAHAQAQRLDASVDRELFFDEEPAWLVGARGSLGYDRDGEVYPELGVQFGRLLTTHLLLAGLVDGRLTEPLHVRARVRTGAFLRAARFSFVLGVDLGLLAIPEEREAGMIFTWAGSASYQVAEDHYATLHAEVDMLFERLGFDETGALLSAGLGWMMMF